MSLHDLLYSVLLSSANDASMVLAEGIGGSISRFAEMMTLKANGLGAINSRFTNPHGLTAPGHFSTARDLAVIFNYALQNPSFREIIQTKAISVSSISGRNGNRLRHIALRSHNRLLWSYDGALGGKTGYTFAAQKCFVGAAARNGTTLIVSILGSRDLWGDTRRLLDYGFDNLRSLKVIPSPAPPSFPAERAALPRGQPGPLLTWEEERRLDSPQGYVLQLASFRQQERAESLRRSVTEWGYPTYVVTAHLNNGDTTYQVRVGPYPELTHAQKVAGEIESKTGSRSIILPAKVGTEAEEKNS
jgi:D-alanyl-D-alanine carboxypeptidase